jgi:hypothetical protein
MLIVHKHGDKLGSKFAKLAFKDCWKCAHFVCFQVLSGTSSFSLSVTCKIVSFYFNMYEINADTYQLIKANL